jgi:hypothetical protein
MILKEEADQGLVTITDSENEKIPVDSLKIEKADSLYIINHGQERDTQDNSYLGEFVMRGQNFNSLDAASRNEKVSKSFSYAVSFCCHCLLCTLGGFSGRSKGIIWKTSSSHCTFMPFTSWQVLLHCSSIAC